MWLKTESRLINLDNVSLIRITRNTVFITFASGDQDNFVGIAKGTKEDCQALLDRIKHAIQDRIRVLEI